jgi:NADPH:quinone reductase-like Zn-dependent oxidoreductase
LASRKVEPIVERAYKLNEAAEALRHLIEDRPFGRVVLVP